MIKISAVSYSNTLPFKFGMENSNYLAKNADISYDYPSECGLKLMKNEADIGLVPVAALSKISNAKIITDFCIAGKEYVNSVLLLSKVPLNKIETVKLDYQSMTSVSMLKIIAEKFWKKEFNYSNAKPGYIKQIEGNTAGLVIGDRALNNKANFPYVYDLANEWYKFTGLQAVFAVWVANKNISDDFINNFNNALKYGVNNICLAIKNKSNNKHNFNLNYYLKNYIDYGFDEDKSESIKLFFLLKGDL